MALIQEYTHGSSYLRINSDGWSGNIINRIAEDDEDRKFQFDVDFELANGRWGTAWIRTDGNSYGLVSRDAQYPHSVVGVSLEHMGDGWFDGRYSLQFLGTHTDGSMGYNYLYPCFGAAWSANEEEPSALNLTSDIMNLQLYPYFSAYAQRAGVQSSYFKGINCDPNVNPINQYIGWIQGDFHAEITTDLPLFATDADLLDWCKDPTNPETIAKMLNAAEPVDPYEEWLKDQYYYKLKFRYRINNGSPVYGNFRWKPYKKRPICLYWDNSGDYPVLRMRGFTTDYLFARANMDAITDDEFDYLTPDQAVINAIESIPYIKKSGRYKVLGGYDNLTVDLWDCNLPIYGSLQDAQDYEDDLIGFEDAENYQDIIRDEQVNIPPDFGELDTEGDNGLNDLFLDLGARMYILSESQLRTLFAEINDSAVADDIMNDFGKLFGGNAIQCLTSLMYFPFNVSDVCTPGTSEHIKIGGYTCTDALGQPINKNNKRIDCGSQFLPPVFNDFRDFEPYQMLYILLPYSGIHPLALSKYLGKTLSIQFACDVCTGAGCFYIYADGILYDSFVANVGQSRPITATDQSRYLQSVVDAVSNVASIPINNFQSKVNVATDALTGNVAGAASGVADYAVDSLTTAPRMGYAMINAKHIIDDPPMQNFGGAGAGNVSAFGNQYIHLIVAQKNGTKATNALELVGAPSNAGGAVGSFSGYLQCKAFNLGRGLTATEQEANEIVSLMQGGVYI